MSKKAIVDFDFCVIGGGIVGIATAFQLQAQQPGVRVLLLEKEAVPAKHQSGHNSGVIHAGIYYEPGSLKAQLCREGLDATLKYCKKNHIPFEQCGKLIVATNPLEVDRIEALYERATANGLKLKRMSNSELRRSEPNINGLEALFSPETAIVDYAEVTRALAAEIAQCGAEIRYSCTVDHIEEYEKYVEVGSSGQRFRSKQLIVCGGLQSDRLAKLAGIPLDMRIIPFRGEYYQLPRSKDQIVKHLIYPAPDPELPFLGIHLTRMIDGRVTVGPNAVVSFAREGYPKFSLSAKDMKEMLGFGGFWKLIFKYRRHALHELYASISRKAYLQQCRKYCPSLTLDDLQPYRAGIRAQLVTSDGVAIHDFLFKQTDRMLHVCNAPSPAATSALPIGKMIVERCLEKNH